MNRVRRPLGGAVGDDPDPTPPEIRRDAALLVDDEDDELDAVDNDDAELYDVGPYAKLPLRDRMGEWRKRLLPLPDEVVHEYLGSDEYVIHTDHPSFRAFLIQNAIQVGILTVGAIAFVILAQIEINWTTLAVFLVLDVVFAILALKRLGERYISYVITNLRLIRVAGIIGRKISSIPWTRMTGIGYRQTALGRLLGYATIHLESANEESGLREFSDINDPATFHEHLLNMVSAKTGQSSDKGLPPPPTKGVRKSFMQRRRERKETLERAQQFEVERARQARERARQKAAARAQQAVDENGAPRDPAEDDTDPNLLSDLRPGPKGGPAATPPRDRGGAAEGLSTPEANAPDRPAAPPGRPPTGPQGKRRPPPRRPGAPRPPGGHAPGEDPQDPRPRPRPQGPEQPAVDDLSDDRPRTARRQPPKRRRPVSGDPSTGDADVGSAVWRPAPEKGTPVRRRPAPEKRRQPRRRDDEAPRAQPTPKVRPSPDARTTPPVRPEVIDVDAHTEEVDTGATGSRRPRRFWPGADVGESRPQPQPQPQPRPGADVGESRAQPQARRGLRLPLVGRKPPPKVPPPEAQRRSESDDDAEALGGLSARDALGSVRKSTRQRPPSAARPTRPRRPTFGRRARPEAEAEPPEPPEPRELPPAPEPEAPEATDDTEDS